MSTKSPSISTIFERRTAPNTVLVISGATSVGKSSVALDLCQLVNGEIISSDSVQVYKQLNVGSNKATAEDMALVPHHLIDIAEPSTTLTTGDFSRQAAAAVEDILSRGKVPVLVGGATMWIQWLVHGIPDAPKASVEATQKVNEMLKDLEATRRWDDAIALLQQYDPARAAKLSKNDWYRMRRSLEIAVQLAGSPDGFGARAASPTGSPLLDGRRKSVLGSREVDVRTLFINEDRRLLYHTIDSRCVDMLRLGHISEVGDLLYREVLRPEYPVSRSIGYRQTIEYLARGIDPLAKNTSPAPDKQKTQIEEDMEAFLEYLTEFCSNTRNYAKRQLNWYRKDAKFLFVNVDRTSVGKEEAYRKVAEEVWHWATVPRREYDDAVHSQVAIANELSSLRASDRIPDDYLPDTPEKRHALAYLLYKKELWYPGERRPQKVRTPEEEQDERRRIEKLANRAHRKALWEATLAARSGAASSAADDTAGKKSKKSAEPTSDTIAAAVNDSSKPATAQASTGAPPASAYVPAAAPAWVELIQDASLGVTPASLENFRPEWTAQLPDLRHPGDKRTKKTTDQYINRMLDSAQHLKYLDLIAEAEVWRRRLHAEKRELLCRFVEEWRDAAVGEEKEGNVHG